MAELEFWRRFISRENNARAVPVGSFIHCPGAVDFDPNIREGLIVEAGHHAMETPGITVYWLAKIVRILGYFVMLEWLLETDKSRRFLLNVASYRDSLDNQLARVYPVGWARANNRRLQPPSHILQIPDWPSLLRRELVEKDVLAEDFHEIVEEENECSFTPGMRMEALAVDNITAVRLVEVEGHIGRRMKLRYVEGTPEPRFCHFHEFDREMIMPCGSARVFGRELISSREYWNASGTKFTSFGDPLNGEATPFDFKPLFVTKSTKKALKRNRFEIGAKLELIDPLARGYISVGTIRRELPYHILEISVDGAVAPDGGEHRIYVHATSPILLPAGFAQRHLGTNFMDYFSPPTPNFSYENHRTVPEEVFRQKLAPHGVEPGSFFLAIGVPGSDKLYLVRAVRVVGHLVLVHYEGYPSTEDEFFPMSSPDLYPVGWADLVGHPVITPLFRQPRGGNRGRRRGAGRIARP